MYVGELRTLIEDLPDDTVVYIEFLNDSYRHEADGAVLDDGELAIYG